MREDLHAASRALGLVQRVVLREHLRRVEPLMGPSETVRLVAPGWWRGHRSAVVVTTSRLLLVRRKLGVGSLTHAAFTLPSIAHLSVHVSPPEGARFRLGVGRDPEEFSVTRHGTEIGRALLAART